MQPTVKISGLPQQSSPTTADKVPLVSGGQTDYATISDLIDLIFNNIPSTVSLLTGWANLGYDPDTVTYLGNRSYQLVFNNVDLTNVLHKGHRLKFQNATPQVTRCTDLEASSSQYYSKSSPAGMTFTDDFVVGAWVKLESYTAGNIASRFNGTSGWSLELGSDGRVYLVGYNGGTANYSWVNSQQALPLGVWIHITAQLDMSAFTATSTTSYVMFDGVNVPASVTRGGTNPSALIQAGNLEIGSRNAGTQPFDGKLAQVFVSSAKITQANVRTLYSQGITSALISSNSIISAYSFDNSINDLNTTNANNLTANNSAVATNADCFRGYQSNGTISDYFDYAIISDAPSFSTNTTVTVQVPEGCTIATNASFTYVWYSTSKAPYHFPAQRAKWTLIALLNGSNAGAGSGGSYGSGLQIICPIGDFRGSYKANYYTDTGVGASRDHTVTLSTSTSAQTDPMWTTRSMAGSLGANATLLSQHYAEGDIYVSTATTYYLIGKEAGAVSNNNYEAGTVIRLELALL